jgi:hypothetical protein
MFRRLVHLLAYKLRASTIILFAQKGYYSLVKALNQSPIPALA